MPNPRAAFAAVAAAFVAVGCDQAAPTASDGAAFAKTSASLPYGDGPVSPIIDSINRVLLAGGTTVQIDRAEFVLANRAGATASGQVVFANDRAKRLETQWVAGDARRLADGDRITWLDLDPFMFANGASGLVNAIPSVDAAFGTWNSQTCTPLEIVKRQWGGTTNPSFILTLGDPANPVPSNPLEADISVIGYLPSALFTQVLGPGADTTVLGVTFTFVFIDANGQPTDIDHDGRDDTALKEIWFNNGFTWTTAGAGSDIDIQTVALHEIGHAFEMGHFGKIFGTLGNLRLHVSPRAVMNAVILGSLRNPLGSDEASFCGNWASWPK